ncbi:hypothetical protein [Hoeflea sp.]|uniref:hypothetical protein n=1 Tax=Hoeflea sp. TaxID=1940281 RepID=UPI002AFFDB1F|nr:hypothetical protein [Hoeflea sp.]
MLKKNSFATAFAGLLFLSAPAAAVAQEAETGFTFSDTLQASFESLRASSDAFRSGMETALDGLSGDDRRDALEANADEARALQDAERALRDMGAAEMEAAGFDVASLESGRPGRAGDEAEGSAGPEGGAEARGGEGPGGEGPGGEGRGSEGRGGEGRGGEGHGGRP